MLGLDEEKQKRHKAEAEQQALAEKQKNALEQAERNRDAAVASDGDRPTTNPQAQMGKLMRGEEVRMKLRRLNSSFHFEISKADPTRTGIYLRDGVSNMDTPSHKGLRFVMGMEREICPEFSVRFTKEERYWDTDKDCEAIREIFAGEMRGWRTIIARLVGMKLINHTEALKEFGDASRSANWHMRMH